jgi:membrane fusion protein, copper/silver efflux system
MTLRGIGTVRIARWIVGGLGLALLVGCGPATPSGERGAGMESMAGEAPAPDPEDAIAYYTCPMHNSVHSGEPGQCPICGMNLVPVLEEEASTGIVEVDTRRWQTIGVRTGRVMRRPIELEVRAVGRVAVDETRLAEVSVKYPGWIGRLDVNRPGQAVRRGETLFTLYSPDLYATQGELLAALASQRAARQTQAPERADYLVEAARQRLRLWDLSENEIEAIAAAGEPTQYLPIVAPVSGYVVEKNVVEGAAVEPGRPLFRIAGLDRVWVEAEIYESDLSLVAVGQAARITLPYDPAAHFEGKVAFVYPYLDPTARTGRVRVELANPGLALKPEMYTDVAIAIDRGERLVVPESAVLYAGSRRLVFVDLGGGRLEPRPVELGVRSEDFIEVLSGLEMGQSVVTSGTFLIAAESRLKSAAEQWR